MKEKSKKTHNINSLGDFMWILYSLLAAFFAGITSLFAKVGANKIDTKTATMIRSFIILIFSFIIVICNRTIKEINNLDYKTSIFLIISGITTTLLWFSYFKALQLADISKVSPIDKTSIIITLILSIIFLNEQITIIKLISIIFIVIGTILMTYEKNSKSQDKKWLIYAFLTALFTSIATIVGKIGLDKINSDLAMFLRTIIVFIILIIAVTLNGNLKNIKYISKKNYIFLFLSAITTGLSWLFYFKALQKGETTIVFTIEKLSIVVAVVTSIIFLNEKINTRKVIGLSIICIFTIILALQ